MVSRHFNNTRRFWISDLSSPPKRRKNNNNKKKIVALTSNWIRMNLFEESKEKYPATHFKIHLSALLLSELEPKTVFVEHR